LTHYFKIGELYTTYCLLILFQGFAEAVAGDFLDFIHEKADDTRLSGLLLLNK